MYSTGLMPTSKCSQNGEAVVFGPEVVRPVANALDIHKRRLFLVVFPTVFVVCMLNAAVREQHLFVRGTLCVTGLAFLSLAFVVARSASVGRAVEWGVLGFGSAYLLSRPFYLVLIDELTAMDVLLTLGWSHLVILVAFITQPTRHARNFSVFYYLTLALVVAPCAELMGAGRAPAALAFASAFVFVPVSYVALLSYLSLARQQAVRSVELEDAVHRDALTGLSNRLGIERAFEREKYRSGRYDVPLSLIVADIDHFKKINDVYGHAVGDAVLTRVANIANASLREDVTFGRWGGEEFVAICPDTDMQGAAVIAERLRAALEKAWMPGNVSVTCSFGVSGVGAGEGLSQAFRAADGALYRSKHEGRNRVSTAEESASQRPMLA